MAQITKITKSCEREHPKSHVLALRVTINKASTFKTLESKKFSGWLRTKTNFKVG